MSEAIGAGQGSPGSLFEDYVGGGLRNCVRRGF